MFSPEGWPQELAALGLVLLAALLVLRRVSGGPGRRPKAPPESTPDKILLGERLSRGLEKVRNTPK